MVIKMKDVVLLYDNCCIFEIVILNYFLNATGSKLIFCSSHGKTVRATEGYSLNADMPIEDVDWTDVRSFIVPGGETANIDDAVVTDIIGKLHQRNVLIAGICAGVDVLDKAGILKDIRSTVRAEEDCVRDGNVIKARANAYVDFAIEAAKALDLFEDETDLQETISFWKYHQRAEEETD